MAKELPFDDDVMTLIMGLEGPGEPGQHGRKNVPAPEMDAVDLATQIRDLCEEFLKKAGKGSEKPAEEKPSDKPKEKPEEGPEDMNMPEEEK